MKRLTAWWRNIHPAYRDAIFSMAALGIALAIAMLLKEALR